MIPVGVNAIFITNFNERFKTMPVLIKSSHDYADEFNVHGIKVMTDNEWNYFKEAICNIKYPFEIYFGTNEQLEFESSGDILRGLTIIKIGIEEVATFKKYFGK